MKYKKPPIVERLLTATARCDDEKFFSRLEAWKSVVLEHFPVYDPVREWRLNVEERTDGLPFISNAEPQLIITNRFWRLDRNGKKYLSIRFLKNQLTINLHPTEDNPHPFEELISEYGNWLPKWINHFELNGCEQIHLDYVNLISREQTPQFVDGKGGIQIGRVLNFLGKVPGPYVRIIPPFSSEVAVVVNEEKETTWSMRVIGLYPEDGQTPAVRVDFKAVTPNPKFLKTPNEVLSEAQNLHIVICNQFEEVFSNEAKLTFEPIKQ